VTRPGWRAIAAITAAAGLVLLVAACSSGGSSSSGGGTSSAGGSAAASAPTSVQTTAADLASHPSLSTVPAVVTALGEVTTAASSLLAAISTACPAGAT
jgi:hypothetical protein